MGSGTKLRGSADCPSGGAKFRNLKERMEKGGHSGRTHQCEANQDARACSDIFSLASLCVCVFVRPTTVNSSCLDLA